MTGVQTCALPIWSSDVCSSDLYKGGRAAVLLCDFAACAAELRKVAVSYAVLSARLYVHVFT